MKRLSLLVVALTILMTASGCCCGLHGCNSCGYPSSCGYGCAPPPSGGCCGGGGCGYQPQSYPVYGAAPSCPTCPNGGCGVQGAPMGYLDGGYIHASTTSPTANGTASVAATDNLPTF